MGLPSFEQEEWYDSSCPVIRTLLVPSSHPEICLTCVPEGPALMIIALREQPWGDNGFDGQVDQERIPLTPEAFLHITASFSLASKDYSLARIAANRPHSIAADGVVAFSCFVKKGKRKYLTAHASSSEVKNYLTSLLALAWERSRHTSIRDALQLMRQHI